MCIRAAMSRVLRELAAELDEDESEVTAEDAAKIRRTLFMGAGGERVLPEHRKQGRLGLTLGTED